MIRAERKYITLVTWADERQGHLGQIYRATNWDYKGRTGPYPRFVDAEGKQVAAKSTKNRVLAEMLRLGYKKEPPAFKHKFVINLWDFPA